MKSIFITIIYYIFGISLAMLIMLLVFSAIKGTVVNFKEKIEFICLSLKTKRKKTVAFSLIAYYLCLFGFIGCLAGCNKSNTSDTQKQEIAFNEEEAKTKSKAQLEEMLALHEDGENICKATEIEKIKDIVDSELKDYMTDDYYNDLQNQLKSKTFNNSDNAFFVSYVGNNTVRWNKTYNIYTPKVDKENETLIYKIEGTTISSRHSSVYLEMKKVDGAWKVNRLSTAEKYNS